MQRDLKEKSIALRKKALHTDDYNEGIKLRKEQDETYKKWMFFKKLNMVAKYDKKK